MDASSGAGLRVALVDCTASTGPAVKHCARDGQPGFIVKFSLGRAYERNGKVEWEKKPLNLPSSPSRPLQIFQTRRASDGSFWINTNQGLIRRTPDGRLTMLQHETDERLGSVALMIDRDGLVWVGWGAEIYVVKPASIDALPRDQFSARPLVPNNSIEIKPDQNFVLPNESGQILRFTKSSIGTLSLRLYQTSDRHVW